MSIHIWVLKSLLVLPLTPNINADVVPEVHGDIASWYTTYNMLFHQLTTSPYRQASQYICTSFLSKLDETYSTILHKLALIIMKRLSFLLSLSQELLAVIRKGWWGTLFLNYIFLGGKWTAVIHGACLIFMTKYSYIKIEE